MFKDKEMLLLFYRYAQKNKPFGRLVGFVYKFSPPVFFMAYLIGGCFLFFRDIEILPLYLGVPFIQLITSLSLRRLIKRARPYDALGLEPPPDRVNKKRFYSFPSNHSSSAGIIAFSIMMINGPLGFIMFILAILTGLSRVFTASHYPSDILAGFVLSGIFAVVGYNVIPTWFL